jgi:hypothetical protein
MGPGQEMGLSMTHQGEFGPVKIKPALLALAPNEIPADVPALQAGGIDDALRLPGDELQTAGAAEDVPLKNVKGVFFRRRFWAYERVE